MINRLALKHIMVLVLLTVLTPCSALAAIYTFVDESGAIHFSNVPSDPRYQPVIGAKSASSALGRSIYVPQRSQFQDWEPSEDSYEPIIRLVARRFQVDPRLVKAIIKAESNFDYLAVSRKGALGLMQLMPDTANEMQVLDPFNPEDNINGGTRYLRKLLGIFSGDIKLSLAAYNAGPTKVMQIGRIPRYPETLNYIRKVLYNYKQFKAASSPHKKWAKVAYDKR
ncbi:MAG: transglycosylase SLT domain-containing protein [Proteobacteria bacterium]|nr:transglycosylase SLT domain-containing protein [Pseudomonadota bacterium]MBU1714361.1 transglycosylase SLT domain-containing protein [Pseudomonadota bacterium]